MDAHHKVLFVDDEEGVRVSWNRFLSARGFDVLTAADGEAAMSALSADPVDVVVSDLRMPGVDGMQLLEWIQESRPETRFVLLTGFGNDEVEKRARELGAFEYLNKPISPDTLAAVVTAATHLEANGRRTQSVTPSPALQREAAAIDTKVVEAVPREAVAAEVPQRPARVRGALEVVGGLVAAPFLGLAFAIFLPLVGFAALFWTLGEAIRDRLAPSRP